MEPNKLENQIKEKLNSREIKPSTHAWDRLDAMLSIDEEKKTKHPFGFLFIAASIMVLLTAGIFFFIQNGTKIQPENNVVITKAKDTVQKPANVMPSLTAEQKQVVFSTETQNPKSQTTSNNKQRVSINNQKTPNNQSQTNNPLINRDKKIEFQNSSDVALKELPKIIDSKQTFVMNKEISTKSDEALLSDLDKVAKQTTNNKLEVKVDAKSLLSQVDGELELTFREKVINRVSKNYKEVKVALANRNNE